MCDTCRQSNIKATLIALALCAGSVLAALSGAAAGPHANPEPADQSTDLSQWPAVTREAKPWSRWWWHGSAVEPASLTAQLEALRDAGHRRRRDHADLRRPRRRGAVHPLPVRRVGAHARAHAARGESTRPRRRHGHRNRLAVRRALGRRRRERARARAQDVDARAGREARRAGAACARRRSSEPSAPCRRRARRGARGRFRSRISSNRSRPTPTCRRWRSIRCGTRAICRSSS